MPFICPACEAATLAIHETLELPADSRSDEITLQLVACSSCGFRAAAVYEESRRGALDSECSDHGGFRLPDERLDAIATAIRACPDPSNAGCNCVSHRELGATDANGRWIGLSVADGFAMRYVTAE